MTFLEKADELENKNKDRVSKNDIISMYCPSDYNLEVYQKCNAGTYEECEKCWNREMPGTEPKEDAYKEDMHTAYNKGLNDAWELARKIHAMEYGDFTKAFNVSGYDGREVKVSVINELTQQEAIAKLKAYESKIEVGDVVTYAGEKGLVLDIKGSKVVVLTDDGWVQEWYECDVEKTGKKVNLANILEQIGE